MSPTRINKKSPYNDRNIFYICRKIIIFSAFLKTWEINLNGDIEIILKKNSGRELLFGIKAFML